MTEDQLTEVRDKIAAHLPSEFFSHQARWSEAVKDYVFTTSKLIDGQVAKSLAKIWPKMSDDFAKAIAINCVKSMQDFEKQNRESK